MKMPFEEFLSSFSTNSCLAGKKTGKAIYDLIWTDNIRIEMHDCLMQSIPPICGCANHIEALCENDPTCDLDLSDNMVKRTIGRAVKYAVADFGFATTGEQIRIPKSKTTKHFNGLTTRYIYVGNEAETVVKKIVTVEKSGQN